jgi:cell division protein FtsI (penicillin-binding protein 3)
VTTISRSTRRRAGLAVVIVVTIVAVFVFRLVDIQVVQADSLNAESTSALSNQTKIYGLRGDITDADGTVLASTVLRYDIEASPKSATSFDRTGSDGKTVTVTPQEAAAEIGQITGQTADSIMAILTADPTSDFAYIIKSVDVTTFTAVQNLDIPWLYYESSPQRTYPDGAVAGNLVGFVGSDDTGQAGVEQMDNACLTGTDGVESYEQGGDGVAIPGSTVTTKQAVPGGSVQLTIDSDLQWFAQQTLAAQVQATQGAWGTVVVQEVKTGKLLAVADYPSVDPNNIDATPAEDRGSIAFQGPFEPGSTFKALTAASLVDSGTANAGTQVAAPYVYTDANGASTNDSEFHTDPLDLTLAGVIQDSSNTGIGILGELMSPQQRYDYMTKFHINQPSEVGFPGESGGILATPDKWDDQTNLTTTFGQGLSMTAVQVASVYQTIANGGVRLPVQLVDGCKHADGTVTDVPPTGGQQVISPQAATSVVNMLETVVSGGYAASELQIPGYRVAAKTGTAQMSDGNGQYSSSYITSLAGLAPADNPQYVVSVTIAKPVTIDSALAAAPVFQKIMSQVLKQNRVLPSTTPAPDLPTTY